MKILRSYILKEFLWIFFLSFFIINAIFLTFSLYRVSDLIIRHGASPMAALRLLLFIAPRSAEYTVPLSFFFSLLLSLGRLISDNELVAIQSFGISIKKIFSMFLVISFVLSFFLLYLKGRVFPDIHFGYRSQLRALSAESMPSFIEPGVFMDDFQDYILYVGDKSHNRLKNIYIYKTDREENITEITFAESGRFIVDGNTLRIKLNNGFREITSPDGTAESYRSSFGRWHESLTIQDEKDTTIARTYQNMHLPQLRQKINEFRQKSTNNVKPKIPTRFLAEFHRRISFSFSPLAFLILGFGIAMTVKHREKSINLIIAIFTAGIYYLITLLGETLTEYHLLTPALAMWLPNIAITLIGIFLFYKYAYFR